MERLRAFCRKNTLQKPQKHPPTLTVTSGPQPGLRSNDTELFCLQCAPTMSLRLADALVLQQKAKQAWKETMSLTLEDFMFSSSLSHQWIYEPGEEFPETKCHVIFPQNMTLEEREKKRGWIPPVFRPGNILSNSHHAYDLLARKFGAEVQAPVSFMVLFYRWVKIDWLKKGKCFLQKWYHSF